MANVVYLLLAMRNPDLIALGVYSTQEAAIEAVHELDPTAGPVLRVYGKEIHLSGKDWDYTIEVREVDGPIDQYDRQEITGHEPAEV